MNLQTYINLLGKIAVGISPTLIILSTFSLPSSAQPNSSRQSPTTPTKIAQLQFPSAPNRGRPQRTSAGGRRGGSCILGEKNEPSLTALMPTSDNEGKTVSDHPELYVYVPKTTSNLGEFAILDEQGNQIYQTNFVPPNQEGIVKLTIPSSAGLKTGSKYKWYFTIICNSDERSEDEYISGSLERTTLGSLLNMYIQQAAPLKKAEIYAKNKIWHDTVTNAAVLRNENPVAWSQLLESVGLEEFQKQPFVDLGKPKP
jgi:hypothetical protein